MKCPKCNSERIEFVSNVTTKGFSNEKALTGCFCFGLPGLLFGLCDSGKQQTREFWICNNCGTKFQKADADAKEKKIQNCQAIVSGASKEELNNLPSQLSKARSNSINSEEEFNKALESEKGSNLDIVKAFKTRKILFILGFVLGVLSIVVVATGGGIFGLIFLGLFLWDVLSYKKDKEKIIYKYASPKLKELEIKKKESKEKVIRLERIEKAQSDLHQMLGDGK